MRVLSALLAIVAISVALAVSFATEAGTAVPSTRSERIPDHTRSEAKDEVAREARELRHAEKTLEELSRTYRHLDGVTVTFGQTPLREQAVAYYEDGEIVIDRAHTAPVEKILAHEVWHVIDWRDNGRIDWGENLPPDNVSDYLIP